MWASTVAFVAVYLIVALHLRGGAAPGLDEDVLGWRTKAYLAGALAFAAASVLTNPALRRLGVDERATRYLSWILAEGVLVLGFVLFVSGGPPWAFAGAVACYLLLMLVLAPFGDTGKG